jgi:hypothetical protein
MKLLIASVLTLVLAAGTGVAVAAPAPHPAHHPRAKAAHAHASRAVYRSRRRFSALALAQSRSERARLARASDDQILPDADHPGWLRDKDHAGWGWSQGRSETVMGVYRRPAEPNLPGPDIVPDSRGAAGVSVNIKLGG